MPIPLPSFSAKNVEKYKGFQKFIKENFSICTFQFFCFETIFWPKTSQPVWLLRSKRFYRHQEQPYWLMFYFWCHMCHMTSNPIWCHMTHMTSKYDISQYGRYWCLEKRLDLNNHTGWLVLGQKIVSKQKSWKLHIEKFSFMNFYNPLYFSTFFAEKEGKEIGICY